MNKFESINSEIPYEQMDDTPTKVNALAMRYQCAITKFIPDFVFLSTKLRDENETWSAIERIQEACVRMNVPYDFIIYLKNTDWDIYPKVLAQQRLFGSLCEKERRFAELIRCQPKTTAKELMTAMKMNNEEFIRFIHEYNTRPYKTSTVFDDFVCKAGIRVEEYLDAVSGETNASEIAEKLNLHIMYVRKLLYCKFRHYSVSVMQHDFDNFLYLYERE